jgi:NifB/MoaA-like Fe-S oxidoreductase
MKQTQQEALKMVKEAFEKDLYLKAEWYKDDLVNYIKLDKDGKGRIDIIFREKKIHFIKTQMESLDNPNVESFIFSLVKDKETTEMLDKEVMLWKIEGEK